MLRDAFVVLALISAVAVAGCYGKGTMGWGSNGSQFEVMREDGFIEVTAVGQGPMKAVPEGSSPEYTGEKTRWDEFGLRFQDAGTHVAYGQEANSDSDALPAGEPWSIANIRSGEIALGERLYFCAEKDPTVERRFGVIIHDSFGGYNLWFEAVPLCA